MASGCSKDVAFSNFRDGDRKLLRDALGHILGRQDRLKNYRIDLLPDAKINNRTFAWQHVTGIENFDTP